MVNKRGELDDILRVQYDRVARDLAAQFAFLPGFEQNKPTDFDRDVEQFLADAQKELNSESKKLLDFVNSHRKKSTIAPNASATVWFKSKLRHVEHGLKRTTFVDECAKLMGKIRSAEVIVDGYRKKLTTVFNKFNVLFRFELLDHRNIKDDLNERRLRIYSASSHYSKWIKTESCSKRLEDARNRALTEIEKDDSNQYYKVFRMWVDEAHRITYGCVRGEG